MLLEEFDSTYDAIINPEMIVSRIDHFPEVTVSCFSKHLFESVLSLFDAEKIAEIQSTVGPNPVYRVEYKGKTFALFQSYVGEPFCVGQYEELIAMGSRRLILLGNCGVLDRSIQDCGIIIPTRAIRDEGTSYHYAEPSDTIEVNKKYREAFKEVLRDCGYPFVEGTTWTNDACYRESKEKVSAERSRVQSVLKWNVPACRRSAISEERSFSSSFAPETIWIIPLGGQGVYLDARVWMIKQKSCCWRSSLD